MDEQTRNPTGPDAGDAHSGWDADSDVLDSDVLDSDVLDSDVLDSAVSDSGANGERPLCVRCGRAADNDTAPATWGCSVEDGRRQYLCENCARAHIRAIEGRLDSDRW
ncbi:hypothetical protein [Streptomyces sp. NPDC058330]|uniref:hypothetical protein n=1 Tax=Streptomyces sp. NPDC058330 TaxID=3346449 RepID=UPI0036E6FBC7